ncbi:(Lyso)-N-acylphosphatidylethanolamine lipase-like isoform X2 [Coccinella septempunctata]|nr:(Lyso)-N-acylphosphatidylethanolamine lipase-like isoform X2 [Coccinella septempunctata]
MSPNTTEEFPYSEEKLVKAEMKMLSTLKTPHKTFYVPIKLPSGSNEKVWTISFNTESKNTPIVLIHGFAAGSCFWLLNFDALAKNRPVYALDIIGFGRSSRPEFEENGIGAEKQIVDSIEEWRKEMNLEKFVLVGHSMGGYICTAYTLDYPDRVEHLVLCDPWGFSDRKAYPNIQIKALCYLYSKISPLEFLRMLGKLGPWWIRQTCDDIVDNYSSVLEDRTIMSNYIYHCNAQNPTGERAFTTMVKKIGRARNPMIRRVNKLREDLPVTILYGKNTWMDKEMGKRIQDMRPNTIDVRYIDNAGHHIYSERAELFNEIVNNVSDSVDQKKNKGNVPNGIANGMKSVNENVDNLSETLN